MSNPLNINQGLDTGTGKQQRIDAACRFQAEIEGADDAKKEFEPEEVLQLGCRVIKHPDCCVLCAANNDCEHLPVHWNCRCKPEGFLTAGDGGITFE